MIMLLKTFGAHGAFDPDTVHILIGAFDDAWKGLRSGRVPLAAENDPNAARLILAKHIIEAATIGERNQHRLSEGALLQLARSKSREAPRGS